MEGIGLKKSRKNLKKILEQNQLVKNKMVWKALNWIRKDGIGRDWKDCDWKISNWKGLYWKGQDSEELNWKELIGEKKIRLKIF